MEFRVIETVFGGDAVERRTPLPTVYTSRIDAEHAIAQIVVLADHGGFDEKWNAFWAKNDGGERCVYVVESIGEE